MKTFLILSAFIGFTISEKLDRTYLPPPGSKFSGGSPGAIDVPLEFPKETYPSGSRDNNFGQPAISIKTDSGLSNVSPEKYEDTTSTVPSFNGNSYGFPTTTTSHAFSQTTSYVPAAGSTIEPDISIDSEYPINNSINITTPGHFREKSLSFDHAGPNNIYNTIEEKQMLNDINNILGHTLPDNRMNSQEIKKIYDESQHSNDRHLNIIPKIISYHNDLGIPGITATPSEMDHSLLNSNYDAQHNPPSSEPISQHDVNLISSTPIPTDHIYSKTPTKYVQTTPTNITSTPYSYRSRPERIQAQDRDAVILNYDNTITPEGYAYSFDTSNGIHADEEGIAINGVQAVGSYSYIGDDGQLYSVNYTADENGFRPYGVHLPTAPPIPDAILKVIEQAAVDKANGIYDDGSYDENKYGYQKYNPTKIIRFPNQYNQDREGTNLNKSKNNNKISHNSRLKEKFHKDNDTDKENKQNINTKNQVQPFIKNELFNESIHKLSPNYKSEHFETNGKDPIDSYNNKYENKLHNKILNSMPHLKDVKIDNIMNIESYDETGYHYTKPEKAADKLINRFSETPTTIKNPEMYNQIVENVPVRPTFMTPYVSRNDDFFIENDDNDQSLDVPTKYHEEENVIISNAKNSPFPTMKQTKIVPGKTGNGIHNFNNQLKLSDMSPFDDQRYLYDQNVNSNNDSYVPYVYSTEIGLSDITSTIPTSFPSRFDSKESSNDNKSRNPSNYPKSSLFQNQDSLSNPSLDQEKHQGPLTHLNQLDNYSNKNNDDITDSGFKYNTPNMYGAVKDYIMEHSTAKTYSEDFSGPKQAQKYDPLTGYHY